MLADRFYVCTWREPWGRDATGKKRATDEQQRQALQYLGRKHLDIEKGTLGITWPLGASLPVPLSDLMRWLNNGRQGAWQQFIPLAKADDIIVKDKGREGLDTLFKALEQILQNRIPVYLVDKLDIDALGIAFQRLNTQGVSMSSEYLFFSALKLAWPEAHDLVWRIFQDDTTGRFLQPTQIVHLAVRLARDDGGDFLRLNQDNFKSFIKAKTSQGSYLDAVKKLLEIPISDRPEQIGHLHQCLRQARQAIQYNPYSSAGENDPGLPVTLLARLPWRVWHTIAAWIYRHGAVDSESRAEMIRYALLEHFFVQNQLDSLAREAFRLAFTATGVFPGYLIYRTFKEHNLLAVNEILTPIAYGKKLDSSTEPLGDILQREREIVMWIQRPYFHKWFSFYDPTLYKSAADLPFDADHILPRAHLDMRGRKQTWSQTFWESRSQILNSPGNIRYWPKDLNRSDGRKHLMDKYLLGQAARQVPEDSYLFTRFGLKCVGDVRTASFMPESEAALQWWKTASPVSGSYDWSGKQGQERLEAFRKATEYRRKTMYSVFYEQGGWETWVNLDELIIKIWTYIIEEHIKPAKALALKPTNNNPISRVLTLVASEVQGALNLHNKIPIICFTLDSEEFLKEADLRLSLRSGPKIGPDAQWGFYLWW
jgi:hypothetical protein